MSTSYFCKISFHYFEDYLIKKIDLRVRSLEEASKYLKVD
jgi:hypothetical protein